MALLLQLLGVLGASAVGAALIGGGRLRFPGPRAVAATVAIAAGALFCWNVRGESRAFVDLRHDLGGTSGFQADTALGRASGQNVAFLRWAGERIPAGDSFEILPADLSRRVDRFIPYGWSTFQLSPRRSVDEADADWLVFYGVSPESVNWDHARFGRPLRYAPRFAIVRRVDAG
jgi:hypothetical protein